MIGIVLGSLLALITLAWVLAPALRPGTSTSDERAVSDEP